ncbi:OsmC family protein [Acrocarpospora sp. B8E8]|uniref:OsmC family protein n=1 Tax=Acrocarpospora sp. B8E8 TaxID=3153572 RepID=UPI00325DACEE
MSIGQAGMVRVESAGADRYDIRIRDHVVRADQPRDDGGDDTGPTPVELLVAGLAACVGYYAGRFLRRHGLAADLTVTATYTLASRPARVDHIGMTVTAPGLPAQQRAAFAAVINHCTVHNTLLQPPQVDILITTAADTGYGPGDGPLQARDCRKETSCHM